MGPCSFLHHIHLFLYAYARIHPRFTSSLPKCRPFLSSPTWKVKHRLLPARREQAWLSYERAKTVGLAYSQCLVIYFFFEFTSSILFTQTLPKTISQPFSKIFETCIPILSLT